MPMHATWLNWALVVWAELDGNACDFDVLNGREADCSWLYGQTWMKNERNGLVAGLQLVVRAELVCS